MTAMAIKVLASCLLILGAIVVAALIALAVFATTAHQWL